MNIPHGPYESTAWPTGELIRAICSYVRKCSECPALEGCLSGSGIALALRITGASDDGDDAVGASLYADCNSGVDPHLPGPLQGFTAEGAS